MRSAELLKEQMRWSFGDGELREMKSRMMETKGTMPLPPLIMVNAS